MSQEFPVINIVQFLETGESNYGHGFEGGPGWSELARVACLCSTAEFIDDSEDGQPVSARQIRGDASEQGILRCYESILQDSSSVRASSPKVAEIPFNSRNKFQVSVHDVDRRGTYQLVMKGAPEIILSKCSTILLGNLEVPIDQTITQAFQAANSDLGSKGERVLGFCDLYLDSSLFPAGYSFDIEDGANFPLNNLR